MDDTDLRRGSPLAPRLTSTEASDGYRLWARVWGESSAAPVRVVVLHGIVSHGGWYLRTGRFLADAGMEVHMPDRRGSGLHLHRSGDVPSWEQWPKDVEEYLLNLNQEPPLVLLGISWGAKLAVAIARRGRVPLAGLGLICPGLFARQSAGILKRSLLRSLGHGPLASLRVALPLDDPALFTEDAKWRATIREDPLALRRVTVRFAREDLRLTQFATRRAPPLDLPTLLMLAGRDRIVKNDATRRFVPTLTTNQTHTIEYPDAAHTLEFEPQAHAYLNDLRRWICSVAHRQWSIKIKN